MSNKIRIGELRAHIAANTRITRTTWGDIYTLGDLSQQYCGYTASQAMTKWQNHIIAQARKEGAL